MTDQPSGAQLSLWGGRFAGGPADALAALCGKDMVLPMYLYPLTWNIDVGSALENCFSAIFDGRGLEPHHALADAIALREAYKATVAQNCAVGSLRCQPG